MKVKFIGDPRGGDNTAGIRMFDMLFPTGQEVDVSELPLELQKKFEGNSHFVVVSGEPKPNKAEVEAAAKKKRQGG